MPELTKPLSFDDNGVQFAWDQTSLGYAENCLRKYQLTMIEGWRKREENAHLIFGGVYASCLEHYHKHRAAGMEFDDAVIEIVHEAMIKTWTYDTEPTDEGDPGYPNGVNIIHGTGKPWVSTHNTKTRENLVRTLVWYLEQFKDDSCKTVILSDGSAAVEHTFALPVENDIILTGHLDRMVEYSDNIYLQDQKTTGSTLSPRYFLQYSNDNQMLQYSFAGKAIFHLPVKGVMVDAAQIAVGFTRFERGFLFFDDSQLNEWYEHSMWHIELAQKATRENYFPMNRTSCNDYGGCPFREVCNKSPHVRDQFLKGDFERGKRWDPLEVR